MQPRTILGFALALSLVIPATHALAQAPAGKKIYCWNENGRKVCGDALPASATDSARTEISARSGLTTGRMERAPTASERSAAELAAEAARVQAQAEEAQRRRDLAMVETYDTETDLRRAYGERTSLLDETLKASRLGLSNLRLSLLSLLRQAADQELAGTPVPKKLAETIRARHGDMLRQQQILAAQERDRTTLEQDLQDSVRRYRLMKAAQAPEAPALTAPDNRPAG